MTLQNNNIVTAAEDIATFHGMNADKALQLIAWSQNNFPDKWSVVAGAMAELANQAFVFQKLITLEKSEFEWQCLVHGVWLPAEFPPHE